MVAVTPNADRDTRPHVAETPAGSAVPLTRLRAEPYSYDYASGLRDSARLVVRDSAAWRALWGRLHASRGGIPALPPVDFAREMLVVAALGARGTGGYTILVDSAFAAADGGAVIAVRTLSPGPRCGVTGAVTHPVDIARLARRDGPVAFRERALVVDCP
jgi:hypothetical protein